MTVSVVIPTYERPKFLDGAITTALDQTYDDIEVIVVDDGSTQQYAQSITDTYSDRVKLVRHNNNMGLSASRNTGVKNSTGDYIAFLDDDDRWHQTKISRQMSSIKRKNKAGLATCLVAAVTPEGEFVHCEADAPSGDCAEELLIDNTIGTPSRVLVRRSAFNDVGGFDESLATKQDWDFYMRLCQDWTVAAVKDHLCYRTIHDSMSSDIDSGYEDGRKVIEKNRALIDKSGKLNEAIAGQYERSAMAYLRSGELLAARKYFRQSIEIEPNISRMSMCLLTFTHGRVVSLLQDLKERINKYKYCPKCLMNDEMI
jgi:glycosyltransferase involved in cell wall biosynthesis